MIHKQGPEASRAGNTGNPRAAWPLLVAVQVLVLTGLGVMAWYIRSPVLAPGTAISASLARLEPERAEASVEMALDLARSPLALLKEDQRSLASFMALAAQASGLAWVGVEFELGQATETVQSVTAEVVLEGPPFRVPVFLYQLQGYRAVGIVESLEAQAIETDAGLYRIAVTYFRPVQLDTLWVEEAAEGAEHAVPSLQMAAGLQAWRAYSEDEPRREARARGQEEALAIALPSGLWELSREGKGFVWTPARGLEPLHSTH